jgi:hypothetical protein
MPTTTAMGMVAGLLRPKPSQSGTNHVWVIAIIAEQVASSEPTDKSMLRVTITNTMPVAMMATEAVWIVRLKRFRGVMKRPSVRKLKTRQITTKAPIMPSRRVSISRAEKKFRGFGGALAAGGVSVMAVFRIDAKMRPHPEGWGHCSRFKRLRLNP